LNRRASALVLRPSALVYTFPASSCIIGHCLSLIGYSVGFCLSPKARAFRQGYFWGDIRLAYIWDLNGEVAIKMQVSSRRMTSRLITYTSRFVANPQRLSKCHLGFRGRTQPRQPAPRSALNQSSSSDELSAVTCMSVCRPSTRVSISTKHLLTE
jgi:hypothetical protein